MPGWSPEIANEFIRLGHANGRSFDQMQLQKLVYIAHGWCLALWDEPLTGDRPEAWSFGPIYRRLAEALGPYGRGPVPAEIRYVAFDAAWPAGTAGLPANADLHTSELDAVRMVFEDYGQFSAATLAAVTQSAGTPWEHVFASGEGEFKDIPHQLVKAQFVEFTRHAERAP